MFSSKDEYYFDTNENESYEWQSEELGLDGLCISFLEIMETLIESDTDGHGEDLPTTGKEEEDSLWREGKNLQTQSQFIFHAQMQKNLVTY